MKRIQLFTMLIFLLSALNGYAQIKYSLKAETGFLKYQNRYIAIDPGPNWKGYYLSRQNGIVNNVTNGLSFKDKLFAGLGLGYLNFEGIHGLSIFADFEYVPLNTRLSPLINLKFGKSHIWNQYENGSGASLAEYGLGLNYRLTKKIDIYVKAGILRTQQSFFIPFRLGMRL